MRSIQEWGQKIKTGAEGGVGEWGIPTLIILVGIISFGLGRLSALESQKTPISITNAAHITSDLRVVPGGQFVGARGGSTYFFPWCSGAEKLVESEKVWFASEKAAQKAGYKPAQNCRGLTP